MDKSAIIAKLVKEIDGQAADIRAEAILLLAMEEGLSPEDVLVHCDEQFRREYSRDIVAAEQKEDAAGRPLLHLHLSRGGIYDQLPEGLFFQPEERSRRVTVSDMAADYKANKRLEAEVRKFFQPIDNDFFLQRLQLEEQETALLHGLQSGALNDYFSQFWDLPKIPAAILAPLIILLPYANRIAGDIPLMQQSLANVLREPVHISSRSGYTRCEINSDANTLGETQLGLNLVCGSSFYEFCSSMEIKIGPLQHTSLTDFLTNGSRHALLNTFIRYFVPAGTDAEIEIMIESSRRHLQLGGQTASVLGYNSYLGEIL